MSDREVGISEDLAKEFIRTKNIVLGVQGDGGIQSDPPPIVLRRTVELEAYAGGVAGEYKATVQRKDGTGAWATAPASLTFDPDLAASPTNIAFPVRELNDVEGLEGKIVEIYHVSDTNEVGLWVFSIGNEAGAEVKKVKILSHVAAGQYGGVEMELDGSNNMVTKTGGITFGSGGGEVLLFALNKVTDFPLGIIVHAVRNDNTSGVEAWTFEDDWTIGEPPGGCTDTVHDLLVRVDQGGGTLGISVAQTGLGISVFNTDIQVSWDCDSISSVMNNNNTCSCPDFASASVKMATGGTAVAEDNDATGTDCTDCSPANETPSAVTVTFSGTVACSVCFDCDDGMSSAKVISLSLPAAVICTQTGGDPCKWEATLVNAITVRRCDTVDCGE